MCFFVIRKWASGSVQTKIVLFLFCTSARVLSDAAFEQDETLWSGGDYLCFFSGSLKIFVLNMMKGCVYRLAWQ